MIQIDKELIDALFEQAKGSERKRMNCDLRTSKDDGGQRMLNALMPVDSTSSPSARVPIHRHPHSNENVILLCGKISEIFYNDEGEEIERYILDPSVGNFGCIVPANTWHTVEVLEPSVIYEAKDGRYGEDGSENWENYKKKIRNENLTKNAQQYVASQDDIIEGSPTARNPKDNPENNPKENLSSEDLKKQITYLIGMERHSGSMDVITPLYVSRMLNVPLEEVEKAMKEMEI